MKVLLCALVLALSCQVILCDVSLEDMINTAAPQIIQDGITKGNLPGEPYYLHHVIKSSIGAQDSHLILDVRQLDNQTNVTVRATINNTDFSVKSSCLTARIGENVMNLTGGWPLSWMLYAPNGPDEYCFSDIQWDFDIDYIYALTDENLALDSAIKSTYEELEKAKNGKYKFVQDLVIPGFPPGPVTLAPVMDYLILYQFVGRIINDLFYDVYVYSFYQPCTGDRHITIDYVPSWN